MKKLDELFKKKLAEQQFDGKEKYWAQLDKRLTEHAQEKVVMAWYKKWVLPLVALVTIGVGAFFYNTSNENKPKIKTVKNIQNLNDQTASAQAIAQNNTNSSIQQVISAPSNSTNNSNSKNNINNKSKGTNTIQTTEAKGYANSDISDVGRAPKKNQIVKAHYDKSTNKKPENLIVNKSMFNSLNENSKAEQDQYFATKEPELSNVDATELLATSQNTANSEKTTTDKTIQNLLNVNPENTADVAYKGLDFSQVEMPMAYLSPKALSELIFPKETTNISSDLAIIPNRKFKLIYSLSVYGGAMYSMKHIFTKDGNTESYLSRRKDEELNSIKPNAGLDVELKRGHWTLTSGFNFHQQGEKRNYSDQFKRIVPYDSLVIDIKNNSAWLIDSTVFYALQYNSIITNHDTTITYYDESTGTYFTASVPMNVTQSMLIDTNYYYLIDSSYNQAIDTIKTNYGLKKEILVRDGNQAHLKGRNTFSYIEIPVLVGYEFGIKRWRLSIKGGIGVGLLTRQQSFYLSTDEAEIMPISTGVYTKIIYNGILRAGLHYNFTPQLGIDFVPFTRLNFNNMTNKDATFQQKYTNIGLQVGVNYKL